MFGAVDLAQDVFAVVLGQVQVHQDQVWNWRIPIGAFPANECEGLASVREVSQFKSHLLLIQSPLEKEDIRNVVFNHEDPGRRNNRSLFHAYSRCHTIAVDVILLVVRASHPNTPSNFGSNNAPGRFSAASRTKVEEACVNSPSNICKALVSAPPNTGEQRPRVVWRDAVRQHLYFQ